MNPSQVYFHVFSEKIWNMRMFKTMFFSSSSFLFGPLSFFCVALDWPEAKAEEGKGLEDRIASFTRCLKYT